MFYCLDLDDNDPIKLYPRVELVENKEVSDFSMICTRERAMYYSSKICCCKENCTLPNTTNIFRHANFIRLEFSNLKVKKTGVYKYIIMDETNLQEKSFQLIFFGQWFWLF